MNNEIFILCCDMDGQSHGAYSSKEGALEYADILIVSQPFHMGVELSDFYIEVFKVDNHGNKKSELIDL